MLVQVISTEIIVNTWFLLRFISEMSDVNRLRIWWLYWQHHFLQSIFHSIQLCNSITPLISYRIEIVSYHLQYVRMSQYVFLPLSTLVMPGTFSTPVHTHSYWLSPNNDWCIQHSHRLINSVTTHCKCKAILLFKHPQIDLVLYTFTGLCLLICTSYFSQPCITYTNTNIFHNSECWFHFADPETYALLTIFHSSCLFLLTFSLQWVSKTGKNYFIMVA